MKSSVALVTGASSGIGQALVRTLMAQQWVVIGLARRTEALLALAQELGSDFIPVTGDVANRAAVAKAFHGLSVTHVGTSLRFSCVYGGPVATEGLKSSLPFTMSASRMAHYMVAFARRKRHRGHPSLFYSTMCLVLNCLPHRWVARLLGVRKPVTASQSHPHVP